MTERLYYTEPHLREFDASVVAVERSGGRTLVRLDRTLFYPTSGGQPFDTGQLGAARVVEVTDTDAGDVVHVVEGEMLSAGSMVHGAIDWERRFDHMQQHTGQHVLSAAFERLSGTRTVSFHLGAGSATIDLDRELSPAQIASAEDEANRIVWENRPVAIRFVDAEHAARLPLRKESVRQGTLRLIDVEEFDLSACGGTHVARTGAIGLIGVVSTERFKGGLRVEFVCGTRALVRLRTLVGVVAGSVRLLSVLPEDLPSGIERLQGEAKEQKRTITGLQTELSRFRAEELVAAAEDWSGGRLVMRAVDADAAALKALASAVTGRPGHTVILVSSTTPPLVVIARSQDVGVRANEVVGALTTTFGGRGGGKPDFAQGGGLNAAPQVILAEARRLIAP